MNIENKNHALLLIDVQKGFLNSNYWGKCNNPNLEKNIKRLLEVYRELELPVLHIQHLSPEINSPLRPGQCGIEFISGLGPQAGELVFQKSVNSAFIGTNLEEYLHSKKIESLVMTGFTSDHCVSTSARMASNLGFKVIIPQDAAATFNRTGVNGIFYPAELVHQISMAILNKEFAKIVTTNELEKNFYRKFK